MTEDKIKHGSPSSSGYDRCRQRPEGACDDCRRAAADYMKRWRRAHPVSHAHERAKNEARNRALRALARAFPKEFRLLYEAELAKVPDPFPHTTTAVRGGQLT